MAYKKYKVFSEKELRKDYLELLELHKRILKTHLISRSINYNTRKKFFILYDREINENNILDFFYIPRTIFIQCLVFNRLDKVRSFRQHSKEYYNKPKKSGKSRKK